MSGASPPEPIRKVRRQYQTRPPRSTPLGLHPIRRRSFPLFPTPPPPLSPRFRTTGRAFIVRGDRWMKADRVISDCSVGNWSTACHYHSPPRNSSTTTTTTTNEVYLETERQIDRMPPSYALYVCMHVYDDPGKILFRCITTEASSPRAKCRYKPASSLKFEKFKGELK